MTPNNRRSESRLNDAATVFVEMRAASADGKTPAEIVVCGSVDFSANGLQIHVDRPLPTGRILRLGTDPGGGQPPMYVVGEVRWGRQENGHWAIGLALFDSDGTDIVAWKKFVAARLSS
ncbi:MAG: PilZ domain-containing protein [Gammaproteobacteria bacterium]